MLVAANLRSGKQTGIGFFFQQQMRQAGLHLLDGQHQFVDHLANQILKRLRLNDVADLTQRLLMLRVEGLQESARIG